MAPHRLPMAVRSSAWRLHYGLLPELATGRYGAAFLDEVSSYRGSGVRGAHQGGLHPVGSSGTGCVVVRLKL
jgi:hypothetical protein